MQDHRLVRHAIGDVANWKCHQLLNEILDFFFTCTALEKSAKLFSKKLYHAILFVQHTLTVMRGFHTAFYKLVINARF